MILLLGFQAVIRVHQAQHHNNPNNIRPPHGLVFNDVHRAQADLGLVKCCQFLVNYGFYKFGKEVCSARVFFNVLYLMFYVLYGCMFCRYFYYFVVSNGFDPEAWFITIQYPSIQLTWYCPCLHRYNAAHEQPIVVHSIISLLVIIYLEEQLQCIEHMMHFHWFLVFLEHHLQALFNLIVYNSFLSPLLLFSKY